MKIDQKKISKLVQAANIRIEAFYAKVFEKALHGKNVGELLLGGGSGSAQSTSGPATTATKGYIYNIYLVDAPKVVEKAKEEAKKEEPAEDVGVGGLFDDF